MKLVFRTYLIVSLTIFAILFYGCKQESKLILKNSKISFVVDSMKVYDLKQIPKDIFIFSPIEEVDKIWLPSNFKIYELDLKTGELMNFSSKLDKECKGNYRANKIWHDPITNDIYIACSGCGLVKYYRNIDSIFKIDIKDVGALYFGDEYVAIGSLWSGLYILDRKTGLISIAKKFPLNVEINSISKWNGDTLLINKQYLYDNNSGLVIETFKVTKGYGDQTENQTASSLIHTRLPVEGEYKSISDKDFYWYFRNNALYYSRDNLIFFKFKKFPNGELRLLMQDDSYFYVLYDDKFVILNKKFILEHCTEFKSNEFQYLQNEIHIEEAKLRDEKIDLSDFVSIIQKLGDDGRFKKNDHLLETVLNLPREIAYKCRIDNFRKQLIQAINNGLLKEDILYYSLLDISAYYTTKFELDSALNYFEIYKINFPDSCDHCMDKMYNCVKRIKKSLDSLQNLNLLEDEYLWSEANLRKFMILCSCWFGDSYLNWELIKVKYVELLQKYPTSKYAEDAEYWLLGQYMDEGGWYLAEDIPKLRKFINKYPQSKKIPNIIISIADSYTYYGESNPDSLEFNYIKAISELENFMRHFPLDSMQKKHYRWKIDDYIDRLNSTLFEVTIKPSKTVFEKNEDIQFILKVKNKSTQPKSIYLKSDSSLFKFSLYLDSKLIFNQFPDFDSSSIQLILKSGESFNQKISLNKASQTHNLNKLEEFEITEKGLYELDGYSKTNILKAPRIRFYFNK